MMRFQIRGHHSPEEFRTLFILFNCDNDIDDLFIPLPLTDHDLMLEGSISPDVQRFVDEHLFASRHLKNG